jgi:branched-chain amino acid transport system substrate-binding protein
MAHFGQPSAGDAWRVGILFSRSGVMKIPETEHFLGTTLAIEEINGTGGILGREIAPVAYDPGSDPQRYRLLAERLLTEDSVLIIFGCCTSAARKAVLPSIERRNGLLWYPSLYEGFEYSPNIIYTGAAPNQNSVQLADFLFEHYGARIYLVGSDYVYPRESNRILRDLLDQRTGEAVAERYFPISASAQEFDGVLREIARLQPNAIFSTLVGRSAISFYRRYADAGFDPARMPIASLTMAEGEIAAIGDSKAAGHITSAPYFSTIDSPENHAFTKRFRARFGVSSPISMYAEAAYYQVHLFAAALAECQTLNPQKLRAAALGLHYEAPQGRVTIDPDNNHTYVTPRIGRVGPDGRFTIALESAGPIKPDPYLVDYDLARDALQLAGVR